MSLLSKNDLQSIIAQAAVAGPTNDFSKNMVIIRNSIIANEVIKNYVTENDKFGYMCLKNEWVGEILELFEVEKVEARTSTSNNTGAVEIDEGYME